MNQQPQGVVPHLVINGAAQAIEFYKNAFGATELMRMPAEDGKRLMHAALVINGAHVYLVDDFPEYREIAATERSSRPARLAPRPPRCIWTFRTVTPR